MMKHYQSSGGKENPDFMYKVTIPRGLSEEHTLNVTDMMKWCDNYPTTEDGYFPRYYIDWPHYRRQKQAVWLPGITFQFECEETALMFQLRWL
jgi:hypothetical protein